MHRYIRQLCVREKIIDRQGEEMPDVGVAFIVALIVLPLFSGIIYSLCQPFPYNVIGLIVCIGLMQLILYLAYKYVSEPTQNFRAKIREFTETLSRDGHARVPPRINCYIATYVFMYNELREESKTRIDEEITIDNIPRDSPSTLTPFKALVCVDEHGNDVLMFREKEYIVLIDRYSLQEKLRGERVHAGSAVALALAGGL